MRRGGRVSPRGPGSRARGRLHVRQREASAARVRAGGQAGGRTAAGPPVVAPAGLRRCRSGRRHLLRCGMGGTSKPPKLAL